MAAAGSGVVLRPDLKKIEKSYNRVINNWQQIDDELDERGVGRKDAPFDGTIRDNMLCAWEYMDHLLKKEVQLLQKNCGHHLLEINHCVHYGEDYVLRAEYRKAMDATAQKFSHLIGPIRNYHAKHMRNASPVMKVGAEVFIAIVGQPQLFIEGNHRSGSVIASWINMYNNKPPFVLSVENAVAYFAPAQEIKKFNNKSLWRSFTELPKYKRAFRDFWEGNCDMAYIR
ncbi:MAG: hypothetical protein V2I32_06510 [Desulforhopalus sp.]|nr:hypothetical protein [Desulforhopalus sp.]